MKRGITLLETIVCMAIIAVLAGILTPLFARARYSARIESSLSNLRQLHLATSLYRNDYGNGDGDTPAAKSLPPELYVLQSKTFGSVGKSPCGVHPDNARGALSKQYFSYTYWHGTANNDECRPEYTAQTHKLGEDYVLFTDADCNSASEPLWSNHFVHFGLGVRLSGQAFRVRRLGDIGRLEWWHPEMLSTQSK